MVKEVSISAHGKMATLGWSESDYAQLDSVQWIELNKARVHLAVICLAGLKDHLSRTALMEIHIAMPVSRDAVNKGLW